MSFVFCGDGPPEPKALFKPTTEIAIHTPTTAIPNKVSIERLLYPGDRIHKTALTDRVWLGGQSTGMYAYDRIHRTVSARPQYSAVSAQSDTLAGVR